MAMKPTLALRQRTQLALTPDMRQMLRLLRMGAGDLAEELAQAAAVNPFLRLTRPAPAPAGAQPADPDTLEATQTLSTRLNVRRQLAEMPLAPDIAALALHLADELHPDGYLDRDAMPELAACGVADAQSHAALRALQSCDPPGIGARDLAECLRLQLLAHGLQPRDAQATVDALALFARNDMDRLCKVLDLTPGEARACAMLLRQLRPRPLEPEPDPAAHFLPDFQILRAADQSLRITARTSALPSLDLDTAMAARARAQGFGADLLVQAEAIVSALRYRESTLSRIGAWLLDHQHRFLADGPAFLRPLSQAQLAAELGLHPSTVSRALRDKNIDVLGRIMPVRMLFSASLKGPDDTEVAARALQHRIAAMIAAEPRDSPLSDTRIVRKLNDEGVDIARRTVAKYREVLRIPGSAHRRNRRVTR